MTRSLAVVFVPCLVASLACRQPERASPGSQIADAEIPALYASLTDGDTASEEKALAQIEAARDVRFVPVLLELVRAGQMGIAGRAGYNQRIVALERLSGQSLGGDWFSWAEWYAGTDLAPPPGFATWKGELWSRIDPGFGALIRDDHPARIRVEEIDWGGIPLEGIPALDQPPHVTAAEAAYLDAEEPVVGVAIRGEARAYPLRILDWHELANDTLGGVPFALVYCTLCGSAIAYDARSEAGEPRSFVTSGLLHHSNKLMLDRGTRTLWNQLTGRPVLGPLARDGVELQLLPAVVTSWGAWHERHPETTVLSLDTGHERPYLPGMPYGAYFQSPQKMFPVLEKRRELPSKERVYGLFRDGVAKAWPLGDLVHARVTNDEIGEAGVVLVALEGRVSVEGGPRAGFSRYEAGGAVRAYERGEREFSLGADDVTVRDGSGAVWRVEEDALVGPGDARARRLPGTLVYWFAWQAFHPDTLVDAAGFERVEEEPLSF